ncbi:MAG: hypothetical protein ACRDG4_06795, partial [Chloroflexota bacterium]
MSVLLVLVVVLPIALTLLSLQTGSPRLTGYAGALGALAVFAFTIILAGGVAAGGTHVVRALGGGLRLAALGAMLLLTVGLVYGLTALYTV